MNASTTKLSLDRLRADGWTVDICERWLPGFGVNTRRDLFGVLDLVALRGAETMGVQVTARSDIASRARKIADAAAVAALREAGWTLMIHGWDQPGGANTRYRLKELDVS